jgi:hypothetical protein
MKARRSRSRSPRKKKKASPKKPLSPRALQMKWLLDEERKWQPRSPKGKRPSRRSPLTMQRRLV